MTSFWGALGDFLAPWLLIGLGVMAYSWRKSTERIQTLSKGAAMSVFIITLFYFYLTGEGMGAIFMAAMCVLLVVVPLFWVLKLVDRMKGVKKDDAVGKVS